MVLMVLNVRNRLSQTSKYTESIESQNQKHPFTTHVFCDFLLHSFLLFYSLFQNKLDFSPGSSVQRNSLESGPGIRYLFCWLRGKHARRRTVRDKVLDSGALFPFLQSRSSLLVPFTAGSVCRGPSGEWPGGD